MGIIMYCVIMYIQYIASYTVVLFTVHVAHYIIPFLTCSRERSEERLPDIMWCHEPFMEELSEIEAFNDIRN